MKMALSWKRANTIRIKGCNGIDVPSFWGKRWLTACVPGKAPDAQMGIKPGPQWSVGASVLLGEMGLQPRGQDSSDGAKRWPSSVKRWWFTSASPKGFRTLRHQPCGTSRYLPTRGPARRADRCSFKDLKAKEWDPKRRFKATILLSHAFKKLSTRSSRTCHSLLSSAPLPFPSSALRTFASR